MCLTVKVMANLKNFGSKVQDGITEAILYDGASISQLGVLAGMDNRNVKLRISGKIEPVGMRAGSPIFNVIEAAQFLLKNEKSMLLKGIDMEKFAAEFIKQMETADDIPPLVSTAFYKARMTKLEFEQKQGSMVPLAAVRDAVAMNNKAIREQILLTKERVEREIELPKKAKDILVNTLDKLIADTKDAILNTFTTPIELSYEIPKLQKAELSDDDL